MVAHTPADILGALLGGVGVTVLVTVTAYLIALLLGLVVAICRVAPQPALRTLGRVYVELFRGIPSLVLVFVLYFGFSTSLALDPITAGVVGIGLVNAAYMAEYFRSAIESVPPGQWEAASTLGLARGQAFWRIVLPQGIGVAIPPATSQAIGLLKESAVVSSIGVFDITAHALVATRQGQPPIELFVIAGLLYLALSIPIAISSRAAERALRARTAS